MLEETVKLNLLKFNSMEKNQIYKLVSDDLFIVLDTKRNKQGIAESHTIYYFNRRVLTQLKSEVIANNPFFEKFATSLKKIT